MTTLAGEGQKMERQGEGWWLATSAQAPPTGRQCGHALHVRRPAVRSEALVDRGDILRVPDERSVQGGADGCQVSSEARAQ